MNTNEWRRNELFHLLMEKFGLKINEQGFSVTGTGMAGFDIERPREPKPPPSAAGAPTHGAGVSDISRKTDTSVDSKPGDRNTLKWDSNLDMGNSFESGDGSFDQEIADFKRAISGAESKGVRDKDGNIIDQYKVKGIPVHEYGHEGGQARGKYQMMPKNWTKWAEEAGLPEEAWDPDVGMTPANQEYVASWKMNQLYNQYGGDWKKVAIAWYSGPKGVRKVEQGGGRDPVYHKGSDHAFPSISEYGDRIMDRMRKG